jgi:NAD(P)H dehydrogenase (quinone)
MKVLIVYAHHNPGSFCHAVLDRFRDGLTAAGHTSRVVDLYASHFDPVFRARDFASYIDPNSPPWVLELMDPRGQLLDVARDPLRRRLAARAVRGKSQAEIATLIRKHMPKDVLAQQREVAWADGLAFIAPIYFCGFPAILKGWVERVFTLGFAFRLTDAGWRGDVRGRVPMLHHQRALIMSTTLFDASTYDAGIRQAISRTIDDWALRFPGIEDVQHEYFYNATCSPRAVLDGYLAQAQQFGLDFDRPPPLGKQRRHDGVGDRTAST